MGSTSKSRSIAHVTIKIPKATKARLSGARSNVRHRNFISYNTMGVAIATTSAGVAVDNTAFSTNTDNPNCTQNSDGSTTCSFSVGALAPSTSFAVTAYDQEPTIPAGGENSVPQGNALSTGSVANVAIVAGQANLVSISLGGIVASYGLADASNSQIGADAIVSVPAADGQSGTPVAADATALTISVIAYTADGDAIVAGTNDPYSNPLTLTLAENNSDGQAHTSMSLATQDQNGNAVTQNGTAVTSSYSSDVLTVTYDGDTPSGNAPGNVYYATVAGNANLPTDQYTGQMTGTFTGHTMTLAPLYAYVPSGNEATYDPTQTPPVFTWTYAGSGQNPGQIDALQYAAPSGTSSYSFNAAPSDACANMSPQQNGAQGQSIQSDFQFTQQPGSNPSNGSPCVFELSDGFSQDPISVAYAATLAGGSVTVPQNRNAHTGAR